MTRLLLLALALCGCRTAAPPPSATPVQTRPPAATDWHDDLELMQGQADAKCQQEQPDCKHALAMFWMPPSPCANQGTRCRDELSSKQGSGHWSCGCDACATSADCAAGERCGMTGSPCDDRRTPLRCLAGRELPALPCPEKKAPP